MLRDLIERWLVPFNRFKAGKGQLEPTLMEIGRHLLSSALAPQAVGLHRIIVAEAERRPEFGRLANKEGRRPAVRAIATALSRHAMTLRVRDLESAAKQFMSLVIDSNLRMAALGLGCDTSDIDSRVQDRRFLPIWRARQS